MLKTIFGFFKLALLAAIIMSMSPLDAFAGNWRFDRWRRDYPHFARGEAYGEDYVDVKRIATRRGEQRCIDAGGGVPYGEYFEICQDEGHISISIHCFIYVPCQQ